MPFAQAAAYSPCQITGFFQVHSMKGNLEKTGSTGAGVSLEQGVLTEVEIRKAQRKKIAISFNGRPLRNPIVSETVVREYMKDWQEPLEVHVSHQSKMPIGSGYGASGAGALGLSLSLNEILGGPLTRLESALVAHKAEVECKTGLGTVTAVYHGGFLVRLKPGAPSVSQVKKFPVSQSDRIISISYGPISTSQVLSRATLVGRINSCGRGLVTNLLKRPSLELFLRTSRGFSNCLRLMTPRLGRFVKLMDGSGVTMSMMMLGNSAFAVVQRDRIREVSQLIRKFGLVPIVSRISSRGARLV